MAADDLDTMLDELTAAAEVVSANLLELERDPSYELLRHMALSDETLRRWVAADAALARLWQWFSALRGVLDDARNAKTRHALGEILTKPSVSVAAPDIPLRDRGLLEPAGHIEARTPSDALRLMQQDFDTVRLVVGAVGLTWEVSLPRLRAAEAALDDVGGSVSLREEIAAVAEALVTDPLSVAPQTVDDLCRRVNDAATLRKDLAGKLEAAQTSVTVMRERATVLHDTFVEVAAKVDSVEEPETSSDVEALVADLAALERLVAEERWAEAQSRLTAWTAFVTATLIELDRLTHTVRQPLEERNELRGRLEAYEAKAGRLGRSEDPELDALYEEARTELYTAPTDLVRAARLVTEYAAAIPAERPKRQPTGRST